MPKASETKGQRLLTTNLSLAPLEDLSHRRLSLWNGSPRPGTRLAELPYPCTWKDTNVTIWGWREGQAMGIKWGNQTTAQFIAWVLSDKGLIPLLTHRRLATSIPTAVSVFLGSPQTHLHVVGMLCFMSDINEPSLPTPFYSVLVSVSVYMALSTVFHSINSSDNSPFFALCSCGLSSALLILSTMYIFMKVFFSPDIIPIGWLGSKHQLTKNKNKNKKTKNKKRKKEKKKEQEVISKTLFGIHWSFSLLLYISLSAKYGGHSSRVSSGMLVVTFWLADAARVIGSPEPSPLWEQSCWCESQKWHQGINVPHGIASPDAEIKVPSGENTELKRSPFKAWSKSVYSLTCYAYCKRFLPCLFRPFRSIHLHFFQNFSQFLMCWLWLTRDSCVGPQNKIGHPAGCSFPCWVLAGYDDLWNE